MILPDFRLVRKRIENEENPEIQKFLKALYLLGAKVSEMTGEVYESEGHEAYGPIGKDACDEYVTVHSQRIRVALFNIKTLREGRDRKGLNIPSQRKIAVPFGVEPWTKELYEYFEKKGDAKVFDFARQDVLPKAKKKTFNDLWYPVEYCTVEEHPKKCGLDILRKIRAVELKKKYKFDLIDFDTYGIAKLRITGLPKELLDGEDEEILRLRYLEKLCR
jgi:hypothetical protein